MRPWATLNSASLFASRPSPYWACAIDHRESPWRTRYVASAAGRRSVMTGSMTRGSGSDGRAACGRAPSTCAAGGASSPVSRNCSCRARRKDSEAASAPATSRPGENRSPAGRDAGSGEAATLRNSGSRGAGSGSCSGSGSSRGGGAVASRAAPTSASCAVRAPERWSETSTPTSRTSEKPMMSASFCSLVIEAASLPGVGWIRAAPIRGVARGEGQDRKRTARSLADRARGFRDTSASLAAIGERVRFSASPRDVRSRKARLTGRSSRE